MNSQLSGSTTITAGRRSEFALSFTFDRDDPVEPWRDEETASWGDLQIWVDGINICAHLESDISVDSISWYCLSLIEWLATNWDAIFHEQKIALPLTPPMPHDAFAAQILRGSSEAPIWSSPTNLQRWDSAWHGWFVRHSISFALRGAVAPDLFIRRWRESIEFSWTDQKPAGAPEDFRFIHASGGRRLRPPVVAEPAFEFLSECTNYLLTRVPASARLRRLQRLVARLEQPHDERSQRYAFLAGLGTTVRDMNDNWRRFATRAQETVSQTMFRHLIGYASTSKILPGNGVATLLFGCLSPTITQDDLLLLTGRAYGNASRRLSELFAELAAPVRVEIDTPPWAQGYKLAHEVLERLQQTFVLGSHIDIRDILARFGILVDTTTLSDHTIRAVSIANYEEPSAIILINLRSPHNDGERGRRFSLAHELAHILFDRCYGTRMAVASGPWAPPELEKRANAFAAMLLMPSTLVQKLVPKNGVFSERDVEQISETLQCGLISTLEHLMNLGYISEDESQMMLERIGG